MRLDLETDIRFLSDERAGRLRKVLVGQNSTVYAVVMSTGGLFSKELIVPITLLSEGSGDVLYINCEPDALDTLAEFEMEDVPAGGTDWEMNIQPSAMGEVFPVTTYTPIEPVMEVPNILPDTLIISQETEIWCLAERWGVVDDVLVDEGGRTSVFVGRPDSIQAFKRLIPVGLVQEADAMRIVLTCSLDELAANSEEISGGLGEPEGT